jgi:hypothetical protein
MGFKYKIENNNDLLLDNSQYIIFIFFKFYEVIKLRFPLIINI